MLASITETSRGCLQALVDQGTQVMSSGSVSFLPRALLSCVLALFLGRLSPCGSKGDHHQLPPSY